MSSRRRFAAGEFSADDLAACKGSTTVSVCLPARNEEATVGAIVEVVRNELMDKVGLVDELIVMDDHSTDHTAAVAKDAGANVVACADVLTDLGNQPGKGETLWKSLYASTGDIVVWCDADVANFGPHFISGLLGPLLVDEAISYCKGFYHRPVGADQRGGGRTTELVARPLIALLFPELGDIVQPLAGEYAGRRKVLERVPFVQGYGVEMGLLIDVWRLAGYEAIAQVDLGTRVHRNRPLHELSSQATEVMQVALHRADRTLVNTAITLRRPGFGDSEITMQERPPLVEVTGYFRQAL
ncbi:MAG: glucosyl-3-phosphoglycerate synthase [bacterium]|nr:glucosyl-3-phosphoglycerate synthase [bacterium]MDE0615414.1 glucosyl-3-phosphoglycerate synthase [bacterium]MXZ78834.1 glucosyl-3-phosphoglycerate synthase [Acidimicrobiia bacterium]MYE73501.1 glucosyl-3-phosphoglycerate synthase [Acidimicrobiia bacterium]MYJ63798.1 glucosyl-3-phosphoglycerate synthase [Acidimicrobiia bacterium]